jgi:CubicO group peptidase (beta-lactamase class C family)
MARSSRKGSGRMRAEVRQAGRIVPFLLLCMGNAGMARVEPPRTLSQGIDRLLAESYPEDSPGVTVIVTRHGKTVYSGARGLADVDRQLRLKPDSILRYASISNQFTAAMILKLTQDGKLALDASASQYLPPVRQRRRYSPPAAKPYIGHSVLHRYSGCSVGREYRPGLDDRLSYGAVL